MGDPAPGRAGRSEGESPPAGPGARPDPTYVKRALERWDRFLLAGETLRVLAATCRERDGSPVRLLEVGCRSGLGSRLWVRRRRAALTAVDANPERLAVASARAAGVHWLRRDPRYLSGPLPGGPFDTIVVYPWTAGAVRPERLEGWLQALGDLLAPPGREERRPSAAARPSALYLLLYRHSHLAYRWGCQTGGRDVGRWAWAWEASYDGAHRRLELHLMAFVPSRDGELFARLDDMLTFHAHLEEDLLRAARSAGLRGAERPAGRSGSLLVYALERDHRKAL